MDANKVRQVTDAKYKTQFYNSIYSQQPLPRVTTVHPDDVHYLEKKYEIDRKQYSSTYHLSYGKEKYALI